MKQPFETLPTVEGIFKIRFQNRSSSFGVPCQDGTFEARMNPLAPFTHLDIDWNLTPEHAVTLYLEWGNNDWNAEYPPVRSKADISRYFVVDTWEDAPRIRLVERNSEKAVDLVNFPVPAFLLEDVYKENGNIKGIFAPSGPLKAWLMKEMGG